MAEDARESQAEDAMSVNRSRPRPPSPWWLGGRETCGFCLQFYVLEMEARCVHCDRPVCPMCVSEAEESRLLVCSECGEPGEDPDDG